MKPAALLLLVGLVYGVEEEQGKVAMVGLLACPEREGGGWLACGGEGRCISKTQVCDGMPDCPDGSDESPIVCAAWPCRHGVRCEESHMCLPLPHQAMCNGGAARCPDHSDQAYCLHKVYSQCFLNTSLGLSISRCSNCFCELRDKSEPEAKRTTLLYRSTGNSYRSSPILGRICIGRTSGLVCDGVSDCIFGEDEAPELCHTSPSQTSIPERRGRKIELADFPEELEGGVEEMVGTTLDLRVILAMFLGTFASVVGFCLVIIFVMFKLSRKTVKQTADSTQLFSQPDFQRQTSSSNQSCRYVVPPSPRPVRSPQWSLTTTSIVKELGQGFYSKVYLAQDVKHGFVALKTVDSQRMGVADDCILNEISVLASLPAHLNIIRLVGCNREEKMVVVEYCFHGNLKDYVSRYRDYFIDELCPDTKEMQEDSFLYSSPGAEASDHHHPVSDFLTSIHAGVESPRDEDEAAMRQLPVVKQSKSLIKTRRLLYWAYQVSRGLRHLAEQGILHRDIALRNILLTNNDVVKIADFGLAVTMIAPNTPTKRTHPPDQVPQYWSRSNKPAPYKWMAPESLQTNVYSQMSDVWGFGVTLWELFTLGQEPYGDSTTPGHIIQMLGQGRRLREASLAPKRVNVLMRECWQSDPSQRPSFYQAVELLGAYMSKLERQTYESRARLDSGVGDCEGYLDMTSTRVSTPSTSGTASKSSTRSRTVSKSSASSYLPSSTASPSTNYSTSTRTGRAIYWSNYKIMNPSGNLLNLPEMMKLTGEMREGELPLISISERALATKDGDSWREKGEEAGGRQLFSISESQLDAVGRTPVCPQSHYSTVQ